MYAALGGNLEGLELLESSGADLGVQDSFGYTAFHYAARSKAFHTLPFFVNHITKFKLRPEQIFGDTLLGDLYRTSPSFLFNLIGNFCSCPIIYEPRAGNDFSFAVYSCSTLVVKKILRKISREVTPRFLNARHRRLGSPLYAAVMSRPELIGMLLDAGSDPELDGSERGTPLMAACALGRLPAVKHLIARGAKTSYVRNGETFNVIKLAKLHPSVLDWLLVGRFTEGPRLIEWPSSI